MARKYYNRARSYAGGGYRRSRNYGDRARSYYRKQNMVKLNIRKEWAAGAAVGFTNQDDKIPISAEHKLMLATMPVGGSIGGPVKGFFSGLCFGNAAQHATGFRVNDPGQTGGDAL